MKQTITVLCLIACAATFTACSTVNVAGKGNRTYEVKQHISMSYYTVDVPQDLESVYKASIKGLKDLEVDPTEQKADKLTGLVVGKLADGNPVEVKLGVLAPSGTKIQISVGKMTDKDKAVAIFTAIENHLDEPGK